MNEYLAVDSGGYLSSCIICSMAGCFTKKLRWCLIEQVCHREKSKELWAALRIGNCAKNEHVFFKCNNPTANTKQLLNRTSVNKNNLVPGNAESLFYYIVITPTLPLSSVPTLPLSSVPTLPLSSAPVCCWISFSASFLCSMSVGASQLHRCV